MFIRYGGGEAKRGQVFIRSPQGFHTGTGVHTGLGRKQNVARLSYEIGRGTKFDTGREGGRTGPGFHTGPGMVDEMVLRSGKASISRRPIRKI